MKNEIDAIFWITLTVYYEARGESALGQKNVAKVILNRSDNKKWPVSNIVLSHKQFSCYNNGLTDKLLHIKNILKFIEIYEITKIALNEWKNGDRLDGATHYYAIKGMKDHKPPYWVDNMTFVCEEGGHRFYRE